MSQYTYANAGDLKVETPPYDVKTGLKPEENGAVLRPDLNGVRIKSPGGPEVYLVDEGRKRWIPNPTTYNNLFANWDNIIVSIEIDEILTGPAITDGAVLARPSGQPPVYLMDRNMKRHIQSPDTMRKYNFSWDRIYQIAPAVLDSIVTGLEIS